MSVTNLPCLPDGERYSNDGRNGDNQSKFPVPLQRPENYSVSLEQEERIESLQIGEANVEFIAMARVYSGIPRV